MKYNSQKPPLPQYLHFIKTFNSFPRLSSFNPPFLSSHRSSRPLPYMASFPTPMANSHSYLDHISSRHLLPSSSSSLFFLPPSPKTSSHLLHYMSPHPVHSSLPLFLLPLFLLPLFLLLITPSLPIHFFSHFRFKQRSKTSIPHQ